MIGHERPPDTLLVECAWEVCNQVGGIYTVIRSKVPPMVERWGEEYLLVGPLVPAAAAVEFEERPLDEPFLVRARERGHVFVYGRWLVPGRPRVVLVDYVARRHVLDVEKHYLFSDFGITTYPGDADVDDAVSFGYGLAGLLRDAATDLSESHRPRRLIAHFHEWMAAVPAFLLRRWGAPVRTAFTTHATLLGRYVAADHPDFYAALSDMEPWQTADRYGIRPRYSLERLAAESCDAFSTISDVTSREAERFLGRTPSALVPNGLNVRRFTATHEFQNLHQRYKSKIHDFVRGHFFPSYSFDLDRTLYVFTSGRYEYRNKGMDVFLESLALLNSGLRLRDDPPTIVAFLVTRTATRNVNVRALQHHLMYEDMRGACKEIQDTVGERILEAVVRGRMPTYDDLLPVEDQDRLKRSSHAFRSGALPSVSTHDMVDDGGDPALRHLRHLGLFNAPDDPVKVVFHPEFMSSTNPLVGLDYEQFIRGCHMGIFPSYYEPWGYTPLECVTMGVPAVTTDLAGFGDFLVRHVPDHDRHGVKVLRRSDRPAHAAARELADHLLWFCGLTRRERIEMRNKVESLADRFDWAELVRHYHAVHDGLVPDV